MSYKKNLCVYMSFKIKRHIYTSVISWCWVYYSTKFFFWISSWTEICQAEMICIGNIPVLKRYFGEAGPKIFYMIHRSGRVRAATIFASSILVSIVITREPLVLGTHTSLTTGLNVLAKNRRNWQVIYRFRPRSRKNDISDISPGQKCFYSNGNVRFENSMHMEWSEEKFLKGIVGGKRRLRFWNKHQKIEILFMQLARYNRMHERVFQYQKTIPDKLPNK